MIDDVETTISAFASEQGTLARWRLDVTRGPERGQSFVIDGSEPSRVLVGQSSSCEIRLTDREVSRRHLALTATPGGMLRIEDLGSTNGTFVDRVRVLAAELSGEEIIRVGTTLLRVERETAAKTPAVTPMATAFGNLVGGSPEMRRIYPLCERLAQTMVPVIIEGETGTGKEVLAEALHAMGPRADQPFILFDCTAVPPNLLESELFGHERGSFTGAVGTRKGVFEQADKGTLFIDEIGDLDLSLQPKLLRALERNEIHRIGSDRWIRVDVRVISATRRDLDHEVQKGRFRDDLFHRLAVARVELPPLRHRTGDIALLARHFWSQLGGDPRELPEAIIQRWVDAPWPGNVRELRNAVARRFALGDVEDSQRRNAIDDALSPQATTTDPIERLLELGLPFPRARDELVAEFERRFVAHLLRHHNDNVAAAAAAAGIGMRYFQKLRAKNQ